MKDGEIVERGSYQELLDQKGKFAEYLIQEIKESAADDEDELVEELADELEHLDTLDVSKLKDTVKRQLSKQVSVMSGGSTGDKERRDSKSKSSTTVDKDGKEDKKDTKQYESEKMETGKVSYSVYLYYAKAMSYILTFSCVFFFTVYQVRY